MGRKYPRVVPDEWIQPVSENYKMCCCDCGLIHSLDFRVHKGKVQLKAVRDNRATGQFRRHNKIKITNGDNK